MIGASCIYNPIVDELVIYYEDETVQVFKHPIGRLPKGLMDYIEINKYQRYKPYIKYRIEQYRVAPEYNNTYGYYIYTVIEQGQEKPKIREIFRPTKEYRNSEVEIKNGLVLVPRFEFLEYSRVYWLVPIRVELEYKIKRVARKGDSVGMIKRG